MKKYNGTAIELLLQQQCPQLDSFSQLICDFIWLLAIIILLYVIGG